jgi:capsular polysaccharide biosynthesis protein
LARKKIRDAIAELSEQSLDFGPTENADTFDFQALAQELRRVSQAVSGSTSRHAVRRKDRKRASTSLDGDTSEATGLVAEEGADAPPAQPHPEVVDPRSRLERPEEPIGPEPLWSYANREVLPSQDRFDSASDVGGNLTIAVPSRFGTEKFLPDSLALDSETQAEDITQIEKPTTSKAEFEPDTEKSLLRLSIDRFETSISAALGAGSRQFAMLVFAPVLVAALGAYIVSALSANVYAARSEIVFSLREMGWDLAERFLATQLVIAESRSTLGPVAEQFSIPIGNLENDFHADFVKSSGVMRLEYRHSDGAMAQNVVRAITDRYLVALREIEQVEGGSHRLLTPASVMEDPIAPKPLRTAVIGALAGLAVAAAAIVLRAQLRMMP